jgi:hypothetical protein
MVRDERGGRFVADRDEGRDDTFTTIAVCDPLFRSYVVLPPIRGDLSATVQQPLPVNAERRCHVFLAPSDEEEETAAGAPESFKVIWNFGWLIAQLSWLRSSVASSSTCQMERSGSFYAFCD